MVSWATVNHEVINNADNKTIFFKVQAGLNETKVIKKGPFMPLS